MASRLGAVSGVLLVLSLILPAYHVDYYSTPHTYFGWQALLFGPIGLAAGHFSWIANPLLLFAWLSRASGGRISFFLALLAFGFAASFLFGHTIAEGSAGMYPYRAGVGYIAWLAGIALAAVVAFSLPEPPDKN